PFVERDFLPNRAVGSRLAPKTNRDAIVAMMGDHYCRHPLLFEGGRNFAVEEFQAYARRIHYGSTYEMYLYCQNNDLPDTWAFLWRNWYTHEKWKLWARSTTMEIPSGKSTMLIGSSLFCNNQQYCTDLIHTYQQKVVLRRDLLAWESEFVKEWNALHRRSIDVPRHNYLTNYNQWVCNCPYFYSSRFLLCKHIVRLSGLGFIARHQFFIKRNVQPPFVELREPSVPNQNHPGIMGDQTNVDTINTTDRRQNRAHGRQRNPTNTNPVNPVNPTTTPTNPTNTPPFLNNLSPTLSDYLQSPHPFDPQHPSPNAQLSYQDIMSRNDQ
ncbi:hypothetical protein, partial, partial [Absidia glauca]